MSEKRNKQAEEELEDLRKEIDEFKREKERVKSIIGRIGGVPALNTKISNTIFIILIVACLAISIITKDTLRLVSLELATAVLSIKLIYIIHKQARVNHFQLWILSSLEWRLNEIMKLIKNDKVPR